MKKHINALAISLIVSIAVSGLFLTGVFESFEKAAQQFIEVREITHPKEDTREIYDGQFVLFNKAYESLVPINDVLAETAAEEAA